MLVSKTTLFLFADLLNGMSNVFLDVTRFYKVTLSLRQKLEKVTIFHDDISNKPGINGPARGVANPLSSRS